MPLTTSAKTTPTSWPSTSRPPRCFWCLTIAVRQALLASSRIAFKSVESSGAVARGRYGVTAFASCEAAATLGAGVLVAGDSLGAGADDCAGN